MCTLKSSDMLKPFSFIYRKHFIQNIIYVYTYIRYIHNMYKKNITSISLKGFHYWTKLISWPSRRALTIRSYSIHLDPAGYSNQQFYGPKPMGGTSSMSTRIIGSYYGRVLCMDCSHVAYLVEFLLIYATSQLINFCWPLKTWPGAGWQHC